jgi:hypothetical protein
MSGNGARPKSQPRHKNEDEAGSPRNLNNESKQESQLRDISLLFRDNERIKNRLSVLQNQLEREETVSTTNLSHAEPRAVLSENNENPHRGADKDEHDIRSDSLLNNRRILGGGRRSVDRRNSDQRQNITSNQLYPQNSQDSLLDESTSLNALADTNGIARQGDIQSGDPQGLVQGGVGNEPKKMLKNDHQPRHDQKQLTRNEQQELSKNDQEQLSRNEQQQLSRIDQQLLSRNDQQQLSSNDHQQLASNVRQQLSRNEQQQPFRNEELSRNDQQQLSRNEHQQLSRNEQLSRNDQQQLSRNEHQQLSRNEQLSRNDQQQLSRKEIELLYSEMRKLQDEIEQHTSRFQENSQPTLRDYESASEDLGFRSNLDFIPRRENENTQLNRSFIPSRTSRLPATRQRQTRSTSYLLGPDFLSVETENLNPGDSEHNEDISENNLAIITAQYEKNQDEDLFYVPPAMSLFNNWNQHNSSSVSSIPNQLRSPPGRNSNQLTTSAPTPNQLTTSAHTPNQLTQPAIARNQLTTSDITPNQLTPSANARNQLSSSVIGSNQLTLSAIARNQLTLSAIGPNRPTLLRRAENQQSNETQLNTGIISPQPSVADLDTSVRLVNQAISNEHRNQNGAEKRSSNRNQNVLERQIKEQRDELAKLIQKARSSPNMNEWHQQASASNNKNSQQLNKTKNLKRSSLASVNIPPLVEPNTSHFTVTSPREDPDYVSVVSEELSGTADNSFDSAAAETSDFRISGVEQMYRLRNI